ncbi:cysteine-rich and transmembrane domain-containing protein YDL012C-like isoform X2 [Spinacia oleracea]|uniref:Cysteine-rich and transmembrane domain-containing protein YDL012C-like isoform X2 n=1 Tax=Spinacia oleracea TaxID=3562 RepID=A0ABM3QHK4_SPIOL|nr:cysteine-rich and transmembrane domain-containing protein YDL012C-like isoform X2 [Spinacia oleracea]
MVAIGEVVEVGQCSRWRNSFGGASSSRPFVPPPGYYFGGSGPQPWGADSWAYYAEMERMRQAQMFAPYQYMAMPPYQYPSPQQGVHPSPGTLRISEQDPSTPGTELDQDLKRLRRRNRDKEPVVDITADDSD